jgi:RHS repeat-associated protein
LYSSNPTPTATPGNGTGLKGRYYDNKDLTNLKLIRTDSTINFDWGVGAPDPLIAPDTFSVKWLGHVRPRYSETYTFYVQTQDATRLWVNDQLIIDQPNELWPPAEFTGSIALTQGVTYPIEIQFAENCCSTSVRLYWSSTTQPKEIVPQSQLLDNYISPTPTITPTATSTLGPTPTPTATAGPPAGEVWRFYYYAGARLVALRVQGQPGSAENGLFYVLSDHLGSITKMVRPDGSAVGESRYRAFGESRFESGSLPTEFKYTGQREEMEIGLYYYNARWYDPTLGRFLQPDNILSAGAPQAWDRYAYGLNAPTIHNDPTGHCVGPLFVGCLLVGAVLLGGLVSGDSRIYESPPGHDPVAQLLIGLMFWEGGGGWATASTLLKGGQSAAQEVSVLPPPAEETRLLPPPRDFGDQGSMILTEQELLKHGSDYGKDGQAFVIMREDAQAFSFAPDRLEVAHRLGRPLPPGARILQLDIDNLSAYNLRMPTSGNAEWQPGGVTSGGLPERAIDTLNIWDLISRNLARLHKLLNK